MGNNCCAEKGKLKEGEVLERPFQKTLAVGLPLDVDTEPEEEDEEPNGPSRSPLPSRSSDGRGSRGSDSRASEGNDQEYSRDQASEMQVQVGEEFTVHISDRQGHKLGIDTCASKFYPAFNVIKIKGDGLIAIWNEKNPHLEVRVGDDLMEVNGVRGDKEKICEQLGKAEELRLQVKRNT
mmetsp:Transcript_5059/g.9719  ORF Transcript_5059/g.9719 Transcript_5059/m.9719 type:complete len:180 (-) Transcript_5059:45-584(-)